jgi:hypothetical protein
MAKGSSFATISFETCAKTGSSWMLSIKATVSYSDKREWRGLGEAGRE